MGGNLGRCSEGRKHRRKRVDEYYFHHLFLSAQAEPEPKVRQAKIVEAFDEFKQTALDIISRKIAQLESRGEMNSDANIGGLAGGVKFVESSIIFKFAKDAKLPSGKYLYGASEACTYRAAKAMVNDLKACNRVFRYFTDKNHVTSAVRPSVESNGGQEHEQKQTSDNVEVKYDDPIDFITDDMLSGYLGNDDGIYSYMDKDGFKVLSSEDSIPALFENGSRVWVAASEDIGRQFLYPATIVESEDSKTKGYVVTFDHDEQTSKTVKPHQIKGRCQEQTKFSADSIHEFIAKAKENKEDWVTRPDYKDSETYKNLQADRPYRAKRAHSRWDAMSDKVNRVIIPVQIIIEYQGHFLLAMPVFPLKGRSRLVYGSEDGGDHIYNEIRQVDEMITELSEYFGLAPHRQWSKNGNHVISIAGDVEVHVDREGSIYILDFARLAPHDSFSFGGKSTGDRFCRVHRPEFLAAEWNQVEKVPLRHSAFLAGQDEKCQHQVTYLDLNLPSGVILPPLSSDSLSKWGTFETLHNDNAICASQLLREQIIPKFATWLDHKAMLDSFPIDEACQYIESTMKPRYDDRGEDNEFQQRMKQLKEDWHWRTTRGKKNLREIVDGHQFWKAAYSEYHILAVDDVHSADRPWFAHDTTKFNLWLNSETLSISGCLHSWGISVHCLGAVFQRTTHWRIKELLIIELMRRTLKNRLRSQLRDLPYDIVSKLLVAMKHFPERLVNELRKEEDEKKRQAPGFETDNRTEESTIQDDGSILEAKQKTEAKQRTEVEEAKLKNLGPQPAQQSMSVHENKTTDDSKDNKSDSPRRSNFVFGMIDAVAGIFVGENIDALKQAFANFIPHIENVSQFPRFVAERITHYFSHQVKNESFLVKPDDIKMVILIPGVMDQVFTYAQLHTGFGSKEPRSKTMLFIELLRVKSHLTFILSSPVNRFTDTIMSRLKIANARIQELAAFMPHDREVLDYLHVCNWVMKVVNDYTCTDSENLVKYVSERELKWRNLPRSTLETVLDTLDRKEKLACTVIGKEGLLAYAAYYGDLNLITALTRPSNNTGIGPRDMGIALCCAAENGQVEIAKYLILNDAHPNSIDKEWTALMRACRYGHHHVVDCLISHRAEVDFRDGQDLTALHVSAYTGHVECCRVLVIKGGAAIEPVNKSGSTPLLAAVLLARANTVTCLLELKADPNATLPNGRSALHIASESGNVEMVEDLIKYGANINKIFQGKTPLDLAQCKNQSDVVSYLANLGASSV